MIHNADMGRGVIGVIDVTDIMVNLLLAISNCFKNFSLYSEFITLKS